MPKRKKEEFVERELRDDERVYVNGYYLIDGKPIKSPYSMPVRLFKNRLNVRTVVVTNKSKVFG
jgi:hypothetical protein